MPIRPELQTREPSNPAPRLAPADDRGVGGYAPAYVTVTVPETGPAPTRPSPLRATALAPTDALPPAGGSITPIVAPLRVGMAEPHAAAFSRFTPPSPIAALPPESPRLDPAIAARLALTGVNLEALRAAARDVAKADAEALETHLRDYTRHHMLKTAQAISASSPFPALATTFKNILRTDSPAPLAPRTGTGTAFGSAAAQPSALRRAGSTLSSAGTPSWR